MKTAHISIILVLTALTFWRRAARPKPHAKAQRKSMATWTLHPDTRFDDLLAIDSSLITRPLTVCLLRSPITQAIDKAHGSLATRDWSCRWPPTGPWGVPTHATPSLQTAFSPVEIRERRLSRKPCRHVQSPRPRKRTPMTNSWIGMSARGIVDVHNNRYNTGDGVHYSEIELENLRLAGRQPYINYVMLDLANTYCNNRDYEKTYEICRQLTDSANKYSDTYLYSEAQKQ